MIDDDPPPPPLPARANWHVLGANVITSLRGAHMYLQPGVFEASGSSSALFQSQAILPEGLLLQALVVPGDKTDDGLIIEAAAVPWFEFMELLRRDPNALDQIDWRKFEEIVAGAWSQWSKPLGGEVILTPRKGDKGRDVIVTLPGAASVRLFDQVKRYKPGEVIEAETVDAMLGVLEKHSNVSKGFITTTADFAPGVLADEHINKFMPHRLELKPRAALLEWLTAVAAARDKK